MPLLAALALGLLPTIAAAQAPDRARSEFAPDRVALWIGAAPDTQMAAVGLHWDLPWHGALGRGLLSSYVEGSVGHWRVQDSLSSVTQVGAMPTLRYSFSGNAGLFVEAGIGINVITPRYETARREFSTQFQFNESVGIGWRSQSARAWALMLRYQHFSNGGIKNPNPGENFTQLHLALDL